MTTTARRICGRVALLAALGSPGPLPIVAQTAAGTTAQIAAGTTAEAVAQAAPDTASPHQELLLELHIGRAARRTVRALSDGRQAWLPAGQLLALGEVDFDIAPSGMLRARLHSPDRTVQLVPGAASARVAGHAVAVPGGSSVLDDDGDLYVTVSVLERLFDLDIRIDWQALTAVVADADALPLGRRLAREARWRTLRAETARRAPAARLELPDSPLGGAVLDWSVSSDLEDPLAMSAYAVGGGMRVLDGSLQVTASGLGAASGGEHRVDATYQTVWPDRGWITQARLGDGYTTGPRLRPVRGIALSNAPFVRASTFGTEAFEGRAGPGWDVELRRAGRTVDLTRADEQGAFALDIPVTYGENSVQVVAFGPHGEVVTADRVVLLGTDRLPGGRFEWGLSGGACRNRACAYSGNLDLRYGLSDRWTVRGGVESFGRDGAGPLHQPYVGVQGAAPLRGLQLSAEGVHDGFLRGGAVYQTSSRLRLRGAHTAFSSGLQNPVLHDARRRATTEVDVFVRPMPARSRWFVRGAFLRQRLATGTLTSWQAASTYQVRAYSLEVGARREVDEAGLHTEQVRSYQHAALIGTLPLPAGRSVWARGELELRDRSALDRVRGRLAYQVTSGSRLEVGGAWHHDRGSTLTLSLTAHLPHLRSTTQLVAPERSPARVTQVSRGSLRFDDATGGVSFGTSPGLERGGISGYVFVDENGNGLRDPGERGLEGVRVVVGGRATRTDAQGRHGVWDLVPFEPVRVWADSASIADPTLVPLRGAIEVAVPPSSVRRVDIAVTPSRELWGRVVRVTPDGEVALPHAELELVQVGTGVTRSVRAYSDGAFYESGVKPGHYELRAAPTWLRRRGLVPDASPLVFEVSVGPDAPALDTLVVRLTASPPPPDEGDVR